MKSFKNCIKLRSQVKIYVPSTMDVDKEIDNSEWVDKTLTVLSELFGGATGTTALGAWVSQSGNLVKEKVNLCFSFAKEEDLEKNMDYLYQYCLEMKIALKQEAVSIEINGDFYRI